MSAQNLFPAIKSIERRAFDTLTAYLRRLDDAGWVEQSYCSDWLVFQVVSHISSGSRIAKMRLDNWVNGGPPITREAMQEVWGLFDSLGPGDMLHHYLKASGEYLAAEHSLSDETGLQEVDGFAGKRPLQLYQLSRVWELATHSWDVYVARDRNARLPADAVDLLAAHLQNIFLPLDKQRAEGLKDMRPQFNLTGPNLSYSLDLGAERPRLSPGEDANATLVLEAPAEELCRFAFGRHEVLGARPQLAIRRGSKDDLAKLRRAFH